MKQLLSSGGDEISSVSDNQFVSAFNRVDWVESYGSPEHAELDKLGGMSGGHAFVDRGLYRELIGIVSQYHEGYDAMFFSFFPQSDLSAVRPDGSIEPLPV